MHLVYSSVQQSQPMRRLHSTNGIPIPIILNERIHKLTKFYRRWYIEQIDSTDLHVKKKSQAETYALIRFFILLSQPCRYTHCFVNYGFSGSLLEINIYRIYILNIYYVNDARATRVARHPTLTNLFRVKSIVTIISPNYPGDHNESIALQYSYFVFVSSGIHIQLFSFGGAK